MTTRLPLYDRTPSLIGSLLHPARLRPDAAATGCVATGRRCEAGHLGEDAGLLVLVEDLAVP